MTDFLSALQTVQAVSTKKISATEIAEEALHRAEQWGPRVGAFASLAVEQTLEQARLVDAVAPTREGYPLLMGVPCPIKDLIEVDGLPFEGGSAVLKGNIGKQTDDVASRLFTEGTLVVGKTATPEFGFPAYTEGPSIQPALTPWDLNRGAGGSSGGAAAAVASGIVPIAHASDGGGSIRIPAASCGLVGLKVSRGLVPLGAKRTSGPGLVTDGVLSRNVRDSALALDVLAAVDPGEFFQPTYRAASYLNECDREPGRLRIGVLVKPIISSTAKVDEPCRDAALSVAAWLSDLGHMVSEAPVPFPADRWAAFDALWATGAASIPLPPEAEGMLSPMTMWLRGRGRKTSGVQYAEALAAIQRLRREVEMAWSSFDVLVTPTLARIPALLGELRDDGAPESDFAAQIDYTPWTSVANLTGRPAISLPLWRAQINEVELPIGVMLTGRDGADNILLRVSSQLEAAHPWPLISPSWRASLG